MDLSVKMVLSLVFQGKWDDVWCGIICWTLDIFEYSLGSPKEVESNSSSWNFQNVIWNIESSEPGRIAISHVFWNKKKTQIFIGITTKNEVSDPGFSSSYALFTNSQSRSYCFSFVRIRVRFYFYANFPNRRKLLFAHWLSNWSANDQSSAIIIASWMLPIFSINFSILSTEVGKKGRQDHDSRFTFDGRFHGILGCACGCECSLKLQDGADNIK